MPHIASPSVKASPSPAAVSWGADRLDIFSVGTDNQLYHKAIDGSLWLPPAKNWELLGGQIFGVPAAASWGPNRLDVFGIGADHQVYHKAWEGSQWLPSPMGWEPLGGEALGSPTVVSWGVNRLDIFVIGKDDQLYHKAWDAQWFPSALDWEPLGGEILGRPAVVSWGSDRLDIFALSSNNQILHKSWDGTRWLPSLNGWDQLKSAASIPAAVSWGPNRLDIFDVGPDGYLYHTAWDGTHWLPSVAFSEVPGGGIVGSPTAVSPGVYRLDVFVVGKDNHLYHKVGRQQSRGVSPMVPHGGAPSTPTTPRVTPMAPHAGAQPSTPTTPRVSPVVSDWESLGGQIIGSPTVAASGHDRLDIFVVGTDDQVYHKAWSGSQWLPSATGWDSLGKPRSAMVVMSLPNDLQLQQGDSVLDEIRVTVTGGVAEFGVAHGPLPTGIGVDPDSKTLTIDGTGFVGLNIDVDTGAPLGALDPLEIDWTVKELDISGQLNISITVVGDTVSWKSGPQTSTSFPVGGWAELWMNSDGFWAFRGHVHNSGAVDFNYASLVVLDYHDDSREVRVFQKDGDLQGSLNPFGSRDDDWSQTGYDPVLAEKWELIKTSSVKFILHVHTTIIDVFEVVLAPYLLLIGAAKYIVENINIGGGGPSQPATCQWVTDENHQMHLICQG